MRFTINDRVSYPITTYARYLIESQESDTYKRALGYYLMGQCYINGDEKIYLHPMSMLSKDLNLFTRNKATLIITKDYNAAKSNYELAAKHGNAGANLFLARANQYGNNDLDIAKDEAAAKEYYRAALDTKDAVEDYVTHLYSANDQKKLAQEAYSNITATPKTNLCI